MTAPTSICSRTRGFTLIEVLLAVAIFAMVVAAIHTVFYAALRLRNKTTHALTEAVPLQQTLAIIKRDLAGIVLPGGTLFGELQTTPTISATTSTTTGQSASQMTGPMAGQFGTQVSPEFCTAAGIVNDYAPWADIQRITYRLAAPTNQTIGLDLYRSVTRNLLPAISDEPEQQWLMGGVHTVAFLFYDGTQWRESWDSTTETTKLPQAIKVQIELASEQTDRSSRAPVELVVPIYVQASTNQTQTAGGTQ